MAWCDTHAAARQVNKDYKKLKALLAQADMAQQTIGESNHWATTLGRCTHL
jgi:hypothetical protein